MVLQKLQFSREHGVIPVGDLREEAIGEEREMFREKVTQARHSSAEQVSERNSGHGWRLCGAGVPR